MISEHSAALRERATTARKVGRLDFTPEAGDLWDHAYEHERSIERHGMAGAVTARAEAHTLRLSMLYALLDAGDAIDEPHVEAALSLWRYCEQSARDLWGESLGDPTADAILEAVREQGQLTRTGIRDLFSRHRSADYERALADLVAAGRLHAQTLQTRGRPSTVYVLTATKATDATKVLRPQREPADPQANPAVRARRARRRVAHGHGFSNTRSTSTATSGTASAWCSSGWPTTATRS